MLVIIALIITNLVWATVLVLAEMHNRAIQMALLNRLLEQANISPITFEEPEEPQNLLEKPLPNKLVFRLPH